MTLMPMYRCSLEEILGTKLPGVPGKKAHTVSALQALRHRKIPVSITRTTDEEAPIRVVVNDSDCEIHRCRAVDEAQTFIRRHELTFKG